jgi:hypothetical protein
VARDVLGVSAPFSSAPTISYNSNSQRPHTPANLQIHEIAVPQESGTYTNRIVVDFEPVINVDIDHYELEYVLLDPGTAVDDYSSLTFIPFASSTNTWFTHDSVAGDVGVLVVRVRAVGTNGLMSQWAVAVRNLLGSGVSEIQLPTPDSVMLYGHSDVEEHFAALRVVLHFESYNAETPSGAMIMLSVFDRENAVNVISDNGNELEVITAEDVQQASFAGGNWVTSAPLSTLSGTTARRLVIFPTPLSAEEIASFEPGRWIVQCNGEWRKVRSFDATSVEVEEDFSSTPSVGQTVNYAKLDWNDARKYEFRLGFAESGATHEIVRWNRLEQRGTQFFLTNVVRHLEGSSQINMTGKQLRYYPAPGAGTKLVFFPTSSFRPVNGGGTALEATADTDLRVPPGSYVSATCVVYKELKSGDFVRSAIVPAVYGGLI